MLGRKPSLTHYPQRKAIRCLNTGKETLGEIARPYNLNRWTISRLST
jgi:hypothetical protein